jgi:hypothetical protein
MTWLGAQHYPYMSGKPNWKQKQEQWLTMQCWLIEFSFLSSISKKYMPLQLSASFTFELQTLSWRQQFSYHSVNQSGWLILKQPQTLLSYPPLIQHHNIRRTCVFISEIIKATYPYYWVYTRHTSSCLCVGFSRSPQSLTGVSSWEFTASPPSCHSNYFGYRTNW